MENKQCIQCTKEIPKKAKKCPECQSDLRSWFSRHPIITLLLIIFIGLPFLSGVILWVSTWWTENTVNLSTTGQNESVTQSENWVNENTQTESDNWRYTQDIDKMDSSVTKFAINDSTNEVQFEFPYNWWSSFEITVREWSDGEKVLLSVSKGQFLSTIGWWEARIKFDDQEPFMVWVSWTSDYSSDVLFLGSEKRLIEGMKTSNKMMIETEFYDAWKKIAEFNVWWLEW